MEAGQLLCGDCYGESYGATCGGCGQKIGGDQLWVEALDQQWHQNCFICTVRTLIMCTVRTLIMCTVRTLTYAQHDCTVTERITAVHYHVHNYYYSKPLFVSPTIMGRKCTYMYMYMIVYVYNKKLEGQLLKYSRMEQLFTIITQCHA